MNRKPTVSPFILLISNTRDTWRRRHHHHVYMLRPTLYCERVVEFTREGVAPIWRKLTANKYETRSRSNDNE